MLEQDDDIIPDEVLRGPFGKFFIGMLAEANGDGFYCDKCGKIFPLNDKRVVNRRLTIEVANQIGEPEAAGEIEEYQYCPDCFKDSPEGTRSN